MSRRIACLTATIVAGCCLVAALAVPAPYSSRYEEAKKREVFATIKTLVHYYLGKTPPRQIRLLEDPFEYSHRKLEKEEVAIIEGLLALAGAEFWDSANRREAVEMLGQFVHVSMIDDVAHVAKHVPSDQRRQKQHPGREAVFLLTYIADKRVIPHLIDLLEHPDELVRNEAWTELHAMVGAPNEYRGLEFSTAYQAPGKAHEIVERYKQWWRDGGDDIDVHWPNGWKRLFAR